MKFAKIVLPDQVIFRQRFVHTNANISTWVEEFSILDGWGMNIDEQGYGGSFSLNRKIDLVCKHDGINKSVPRFDKQ